MTAAVSIRDPRVDPRTGDKVCVAGETREVAGLFDRRVQYSWPDKLAVEFWKALAPLMIRAMRDFDTTKTRAKFLAYFGYQFAGSLASELGANDAADLLEMIARVVRSTPMPAKRRIH